jgi:hydrogenase expression/formation protein HypC
MKVAEIDGNIIVASAGGLRRKADISLLKDVRRGEYVLIHAGFAIEKVNPSEAKKTLKAIKDL